MFNRIAAVVVLYNWSEEEIKNIDSYSKYFDEIILVDNSDHDVPKLKEDGRYTYVKLGDNFGIGYALNEGIKIAKSSGVGYIVTMDQDSKFDNDTAKTYRDIIKNNDLSTEIIAPVYTSDDVKKRDSRKDGAYTLLVQSGAMFNVAVFDKVGMFNDGLFIDVVDYEFAIRATKSGIKIKKCTDIVLNHKPGARQKKRIIFKTVSFVSHNPNRMYYQARNLLWVAKKYRSYTLFKIYLRLFIKILFLFDDKRRDFRMYMKGTSDAIHGKLGRVVI